MTLSCMKIQTQSYCALSKNMKVHPNIILFDKCENPKGSKYLQHNHNGLGSDYLVSMSHFRRNSVEELLHKYDEETQMYIAFFVCSLTHSQIHHFASTMDRVIKDTKQSCHNAFKGQKPNNTNIKCDIPTTSGANRKFITNGKFAIFDNLPYPLIYVVGGHSCISAKGCVADLLGHGFPIPRSSIGECRILIWDTVKGVIKGYEIPLPKYPSETLTL
jgi:hypothetical protein